MIFGPAVVAAPTARPADWIRSTLSGPHHTVGSLIPNRFAEYLRIAPPEPGTADWWSRYQDVFAAIASICELHTDEPGHAWFAIWDGYGFETTTSHLAWTEPVAEEARLALERRRAEIEEQSRLTNLETRSALRAIPRFALTHRDYYLLSGPVAATTRLCTPGSPTTWQRPDLFWPDDRRWFVGTDVDFYSVFVGGPPELVSALAEAVPTSSSAAGRQDHIELDD